MRKRTVFVIGILIVLALPVAFFVITTKMASPSTIVLIAPETTSTDTIHTSADHIVNIWLLSRDEIYGYEGNNYEAGKKYKYNELRGLLAKEKKDNGNNLFVMIKQSKNASYKNAVDALDEITINHINKFTLVKLSKKEQGFVEKLNLNN
jgi:biopolymer transport protein ExbD